MIGYRKYHSLDDFKHRRKFGDTAPDGKGYVYIIELGNTVKIGCTTHIITRILTHSWNAHTNNTEQPGRICVSPLLSHITYYENILHRRFAAERSEDRREIFSITFDDAVLALRSIRRKIPKEFYTFPPHVRKTNCNKHPHGSNVRLKNTLNLLYRRPA